jgi:hypothetical protein
MAYGYCKILIILLIVISLCACRELGNNSDDNNKTVYQGHFVFGPAEGLEYECDDLSGTTDAEGLFEYYKGESVAFYIGDLLLGSIVGKSRVTPLDFEDEATIDNISKLLLNADDDRNPNNGITISQNLAELIGHSQDYYPSDICAELTWDAVDYLVFYDSPLDSSTCEPEEGVTLHQIILEDGNISNSTLSTSSDAFKNNPIISNLFLNAFLSDNAEIGSLLEFNTDSTVTPGYYSYFWGLPESYNSYQSDLIEKHLQYALFSYYIGTYSGSYEGGGYSGDITFFADINFFGDCKLRDTYGDNTLDGDVVRVYGEITDSETGSFEFNLSTVWLVFKGNIDSDTGDIEGKFYDYSGNYLGTFSCTKE